METNRMRKNQKGFTLIELMVATAVGLLVMAGISKTYVSHQRSHVNQQLVVEMQQNARAAMSLMKREIRMTGFDPKESNYPNPINVASADEIEFAMDLDGDGNMDTAEDIKYYIKDGDLVRELVRETDADLKLGVLAYDIEAVGFAYAVDDDTPPDGELDLSGPYIKWTFDSNDGDFKLDQSLDTNSDGDIDTGDEPGGTNFAGQIEYEKIRAVKIWLLARTRAPIRGHTDNKTYVVGPYHIGPHNDSYKRVLLSTTVYCRNMGI